MKKVLAMAALILGGVVSQLVIIPQAQAQRVYVGMNDYGDKEVYILTETIRDITFKGYSGFSVQFEDARAPIYFIRKDGVWCFLMGLNERIDYPAPAKGILLKTAEVANQYR